MMMLRVLLFDDVSYNSGWNANFDIQLTFFSFSPFRNPQCWGGHIELQAMSIMHEMNFIIYKDEGLEELLIENGFEKQSSLCFCHGNHYDRVVTKEQFDNLKFCQGSRSLLSVFPCTSGRERGGSNSRRGLYPLLD